ncbi:hypothetical protein HZY91_04080 [Facklamia sp. DSM 111018]|uniref:Uncharacterized protein n=1 Tax=Facklamia lactis TaxID=2749967 RepID=A0ABS0LPL3_9LACT|nr:hypothetical protein [Facklamia lactis]MBG9980266.1 hypothetical protein [Facklamia lactis]MBG9986069.1 hypothetical protein [Facklamia lactis]
MSKFENFVSAICSGFVFALLAGALMSYWVWLEMRVHTWVLCWLVFALFLMVSILFKIKPITFFIGEVLMVVLMFIKSPNIFYYNVRDMFFLETPLSTNRMITLAILAIMTFIMVYLVFRNQKQKAYVYERKN